MSGVAAKQPEASQVRITARYTRKCPPRHAKDSSRLARPLTQAKRIAPSAVSLDPMVCAAARTVPVWHGRGGEPDSDRSPNTVLPTTRGWLAESDALPSRQRMLHAWPLANGQRKRNLPQTGWRPCKTGAETEGDSDLIVLTPIGCRCGAIPIRAMCAVRAGPVARGEAAALDSPFHRPHTSTSNRRTEIQFTGLYLSVRHTAVRTYVRTYVNRHSRCSSCSVQLVNSAA
jgi:hypothetical protein